MHRKWYVTGFALIVLAMAGLAFAGLRRERVEAVAGATEAAPVSLKVDVSERRLYVVAEGEVIESYPVAVGKPGHATPRGSYSVRRIIWNPRWVPPEAEWAKEKTPKPPGHPENPMGRVKIFFRDPDYYLHGTNATETLGSAASHGCVRMRNSDIIEVAQLLMDHGGAPVEPGLIQRLINRVKQTKEVRLSRPVRLRVQT